MTILLIRPGMLTTLQDIGRRGYQRQGIVVSGAMDSFALRIANLLVGNSEHEAAIEITLVGPSIQIQADTLLVICGADLSATCQGQRLPMWRPVLVRAGSLLEFGKARLGCRSYLAVAGGFDVALRQREHLSSWSNRWISRTCFAKRGLFSHLVDDLHTPSDCRQNCLRTPTPFLQRFIGQSARTCYQSTEANPRFVF